MMRRCWSRTWKKLCCVRVPSSWFAWTVLVLMAIMVILKTGDVNHYVIQANSIPQENTSGELMKISVNTQKDHSDKSKGNQIFSNDPVLLDYDLVFNSTWPMRWPLVVFSTMGRLGNCLNTYATALAMQKIYTNATIAVSEKIYDAMKNIFEPKYFQLPVMTEGFQYEVSDYIKTIHPDYIKGDMVSHIKPTLDQLTREYAKTGNKRMVVMEGYPNRINLLGPYLKDIQNNLHIRPHLLQKVSNYIKGLNKDHGGNVTMVGFHIRRGDMVKFFKNYFHHSIPAGKYYESALALQRSNLHNPLFVVTSDNRTYAQEQLKQHRDVVFSPFDKDIEDFALLASCSHSVMTVGSFGFWSAFLAGGSVVYAHVPGLNLIVDPDNLGPIGFQRWHPFNMDGGKPNS